VPDALTTLPLDDTVLITPVDSAQAKEWLKEDAVQPPGGGGGTGGGGGPTPAPPPPPTTASRVTAMTWEKVLEYVAERPLLELHLVAKVPGDGAGIPAIVQPLGADQLTTSVSVSGVVKDGGTMDFAADGMRLNHPAKPLQIAQTIFNSLNEGCEFEVDFALSFGKSGRTGLETQLEQLRDATPDGVSVKATFDKPVEVKA
jgi:hypothetical protein